MLVNEKRKKPNGSVNEPHSTAIFSSDELQQLGGVESTLGQLKGIEDVAVNSLTGRITVTYDHKKLTLNRIREFLVNADKSRSWMVQDHPLVLPAHTNS